jgi:hypothetical protein
MDMRGIAFDEILRTLPANGEIKVTLSEIPLDELLITVHETRFSGRMWIHDKQNHDELRFRRGQVLRVIPSDKVHLRLLQTTLFDLDLVDQSTFEAQHLADARLSAADLLDCFVLRRVLALESVKKVHYELARRRLLELFELRESDLVLENSFEAPEDADAILLNPLPAVAYGLVACASSARRQAVLAYAANQFAKLNVAYDVSRNRLGLPDAFVSAVKRLSEDGILFGDAPCLPDLSADETAGLLLLFRRLGLLMLTSQPPAAGRPLSSVDADEVTERLDREFS